MKKEPTIEELKAFLGEYLRLKGINTSSFFRCVSPNHEDKHPSMSFYKKGNICNCFACGEKYNIFRLVGMEYGLKGFKEQKEKKYPELDYYYLECKKRVNETEYLQRRGISKEV